MLNNINENGIYIIPPELMIGYKDKERLGLVASTQCCACRIKRAPIVTKLEVHHLIGCGATGGKASDLLTICLCAWHHQRGGRGEAVHKGKFIFAENYKSERQFLAITNETIIDKNRLRDQQLRNYELIKEWLENEKKRGIV